ncbi:hypothetical protein OS189_02710 [Sulfitobacter sp. F26169L]|uniref:hypothetical protein n=1 Tax=Sulfitobacter sp. F26169L TaxID=2996015 RepID=UPI002260DAB5|nr:hypothetical protein [Sulfitobacter sp. F26169L]MCX7565256.1 hypothetical protein [Sulfitobacter sp. F26169L]
MSIPVTAAACGACEFSFEVDDFDEDDFDVDLDERGMDFPALSLKVCFFFSRYIVPTQKSSHLDVRNI